MNNAFLNSISRPWNIHGASFVAYAMRMLAKTEPASTLTGWRDRFSQFIPQRQEMDIDSNGIAHVSVHGALFNKEAPYFVAGYGGTDYEEIIADIATANKEARGIILSIDSPGGHACGNNYVSEIVSSAKKPVFAFTDGMCCSAAYSIAAGCAYICATPDATIGSIGTILPLLDVSGLWEAFGIKPDYITNKEGDLKTAGHPPSQTDEERASLQEETQSYYELFKSHVLTHRDISKESMRGQAFVGNVALKNNLIDEVCDRQSAYSKLANLTRR